MKPETKKAIWSWTRTIVLAGVIALAFRHYVAEARLIPSESMVPTLKVGDRLAVEKISYKIEGFHRGDILVFRAPASSNLNEDLIKRVIGLPGETVEVKGGLVYINGKALNEPYELEKPNKDFGPYTVPKDSLFMMGDNRNNSYDSRFWGPIKIDDVIGKAVARYYPFSAISILK